MNAARGKYPLNVYTSLREQALIDYRETIRRRRDVVSSATLDKI